MAKRIVPNSGYILHISKDEMDDLKQLYFTGSVFSELFDRLHDLKKNPIADYIGLTDSSFLKNLQGIIQHGYSLSFFWNQSAKRLSPFFRLPPELL